MFKGSSYAPSKKLNEISNMIMNMDFIDALDTERRITTINRSVKRQMNSIVESVILNIEK